MAEIVRMPKMSDTMTEGVVSKWHKKVGDVIKSGDLVAEIETDKATMEFESYQNGTLLYIGVAEGKGAPVDSILAILGNAGEDFSSLLEAEKSKAAKPAEVEKTVEQKPAATAAPPKPVETVPAPQPQPVVVSTGDDRIKASPLAKKLASEKGIDLSMLKGSGNNGRVVKRDIDWFKPGSYSPSGYSTGLTAESFEIGRAHV